MADKSIATVALAKAVGEATKAAAKGLGRYAGAAGLPNFLIDPSAGVIAAVVEHLVAAVFEESKQLHKHLDRKMDVLLTEPLQTSTTRLNHILQATMQSKGDIAEVHRQLDEVYGTLMTALTYAEGNDPDAILTVRAYLALVAAIKKNGRAFAQIHIEFLLTAAAALRQEHESLAREEASLDQSLARANENFRRADEAAQYLLQ